MGGVGASLVDKRSPLDSPLPEREGSGGTSEVLGNVNMISELPDNGVIGVLGGNNGGLS